MSRTHLQNATLTYRLYQFGTESETIERPASILTDGLSSLVRMLSMIIATIKDESSVRKFCYGTFITPCFGNNSTQLPVFTLIVGKDQCRMYLLGVGNIMVGAYDESAFMLAMFFLNAMTGSCGIPCPVGTLHILGNLLGY